jgi:hypothetical protein
MGSKEKVGLYVSFITRGSWTVTQIHFAGFLDGRITFEELHGSTKDMPYT